MNRKSLLELELTIPSINLLDSRTLLGGTNGYTFDGGELPEVEIWPDGISPPWYDNPQDWRENDDPWDERDDPQHERDDPDEQNARPEENNDAEPKITPHQVVEGFNPTSGEQLLGGCVFSSFLEIHNHNNSGNMTLSDVYNSWLAYCLANDVQFSFVDGVPLEHVGSFYEFMFGEEMSANPMESLDNGEVVYGWMQFDDEGHAVVICGYGYDDDGNLWYYYWDPQYDDYFWMNAAN
jgi:hypothetical protein